MGVRIGTGYDWSEAALERLRTLWAEGVSTAEIGRRMGTTKSSIIGKAHRLKLAPRPSPMVKGGAPRTPPPERFVRTSGRAGSGIRLAPPEPLPPSLPMFAGAGAAELAAAAPEPVTTMAGGGCRFPLWGQRERPTHRYCGAAALEGESWCPDHHRLVFRPLRAAV